MNIPEGYKLVPVFPTDDMRDAGNVFVLSRAILFESYRAMLAAAPAPPQPIYDEAKERELFESQLGHLMRSRDGDGSYSYDAIQDQWYGWSACAQSRAKAGEVGDE